MCSNRKTWKFTENCSGKMEQLKVAISEAEAVVIGAGAGLSTSAGFTYGGERFQRYFSDFIKKYGFTDMYSGGFFPFETLEEHWAYWSRYIFINRYMEASTPLYKQLFALMKNKNYFVLTTNVDHQFQKAGFDKQRLFYTQGDFGLFQCSKPCHAETYDNEEEIRQMMKQQKDMRIPSELIPRCPKCGRPMSMNLRADDTFVEDASWHRAADRYAEFLRQNHQKKLLLLELGVGGNTPVIIKYPFWRMTHQWDHVIYACVNKGEAYVPREIQKQSICIDADIQSLFSM